MAIPLFGAKQVGVQVQWAQQVGTDLQHGQGLRSWFLTEGWLMPLSRFRSACTALGLGLALRLPTIPLFTASHTLFRAPSTSTASTPLTSWLTHLACANPLLLIPGPGCCARRAAASPGPAAAAGPERREREAQPQAVPVLPCAKGVGVKLVWGCANTLDVRGAEQGAAVGVIGKGIRWY